MYFWMKNVSPKWISLISYILYVNSAEKTSRETKSVTGLLPLCDHPKDVVYAKKGVPKHPQTSQRYTSPYTQAKRGDELHSNLPLSPRCWCWRHVTHQKASFAFQLPHRSHLSSTPLRLPISWVFAAMESSQNSSSSSDYSSPSSSSSQKLSISAYLCCFISYFSLRHLSACLGARPIPSCLWWFWRLFVLGCFLWGRIRSVFSCVMCVILIFLYFSFYAMRHVLGPAWGRVLRVDPPLMCCWFG